MNIRPCTDVSTIKRIWGDPVLWGALNDDSNVRPEDWDPSPLPGELEWLEFDLDGEIVGLLMMERKNTVTWRIHVGFTPGLWGKGVTKQFGRPIVASAFTHTGAMKLEAEIPVCMEPVWRYALFSGFEIEGLSRASYLKEGKLLDCYHLGICRELSEEAAAA